MDRPRPAAPSSWVRAGAVLCTLGLLAFLGLWNADDSSGLERLVSRGLGLGAFLVAWFAGALCLLVGALRRRRRRERPRLHPAALGLGLAPALVVLWVSLVHVTPERLVRAAGRGDVGEVERCLRWGVDVDARCEELLGFGGRRESATALGAAAAAGRAEVVDLLLDAGADPTELDAYGRTPAEAAADGGFRELADRLATAERRPPPGC